MVGSSWLWGDPVFSGLTNPGQRGGGSMPLMRNLTSACAESAEK